MERNKVVEALRVLQEEGREDLIKEGVLEQAWVGLRRPKRSSAEGVSAAILACTSPAISPRKSRKFKAKSVSGRKAVGSLFKAACGGPRVGVVSGCDARFRAGGGAPLVHADRQLKKLAVGAHARRRRRLVGSRAQQAQLALESEGSAQAGLDERTLGGAAKMAAPSGFSVISEVGEDLQSGVYREVSEDTVGEDIVIVLDSEDDLETGNDPYDEGCSQSLPMSFRLPVQIGRNIQWIPREVSPMVHRVQEWEVSNQSVLRAGEQVDFVDGQGVVIRGTICGTAVEDETAGSAQVRLDFRQGERAYRPVCDVPRALGGHEVAAAGQRLGRPAVFSRPVEVRAPSRHRVEERVQPRAVRPTSREIPVNGEGSSASNASGLRSFPASQGALSVLTGEEEVLDYEEEDTSRSNTVTKTPSGKKAVPGDRLTGGKNVLSSNLIRGEVTNTLGAVGEVCGTKVVGDNLSNVDLAIQVEQEGKRGSLSGAIDVVSGAVKRMGGLEGLAQRREDAVQFIMQQIELGLSAVTISGFVGGPDGSCSVWIVGHSFVRWTEKQAASRNVGKQLGLDGARIRISWVEGDFLVPRYFRYIHCLLEVRADRFIKNSDMQLAVRLQFRMSK
ncbi:hypothetical protein NDU88_003829 [Pleurodeles waltl]|uniref:Uncharacterized protein n=1 Tax=Pleurodeles waltl TaxID=8319 RepID=A0AAV7VEE0_PLEWA|nr:hypothetical protein NDU88_003829 [Pleurodeles waltl]